MLKYFRSVIDLWGSHAELANDIEESPDVVRKWHERDRIPSHAWHDLVVAAKNKRLPVDLETLATIAKQQRRTSARASA